MSKKTVKPEGELIPSEGTSTQKDLAIIENHLTAINPNIFVGIDEEKKIEILEGFSFTLIQSHTSETSHSGPLPSPDYLRDYNEIIPNGADRIKSLAEGEQTSRHILENEGVKQSKRGQWFGFIIGIFGIACGTFLAYNGESAVGGIVAGTTVVSLVSVFVIGKIVKRKQED